MDISELEQWAQSHQTDIRIAGAIFELASGDEEEMENIWRDPSEREIDFALAWVPKDEHSETYWGIDRLSSLR